MRVEQLLKRPQSLGRPRQGERAGGVEVEAVNHADIGRMPVSDREILTHALDERVALAERCRQRQHAGRFVNDDDVLIFV